MAVFSTGFILLLPLMSVTGMAVISQNDTNVTAEEVEVITRTVVLTTTTGSSVQVPEILVTLGFIGGCAIMGVVISKGADMLYDKYINGKSKDTSKSEAAKKLLRARVAIMRMKPDPKSPDALIAKKAAATWMSRTVGKKEVSVDIAGARKIGQSHVPGIPITGGNGNNPDDHKGQASTPVLPLVITNAEETTSEEKSPSKAIDQQATPHTENVEDLHPIERINIKIKPGGPLPPVAVHDMPKLPTL